MKSYQSMQIIILILLIDLSILNNFNPVTGNFPSPLIQNNHSPIKIISNSNFTIANGIVAGNGTVLNPYILENWSIDASITDGISIIGTTSYFIIRNCHIFNDTLEKHTGIVLTRTMNGNLNNNTIDNNWIGINIDKSNNINSQNNTIFSHIGISITDSNNNIFKNISIKSTINNTHGVGFDIYNSTNEILEELTIEKSKGIYIKMSKNITINHSQFNGWQNDGGGITIESYSTEIVIDNNVIHNHNSGIFLTNEVRNSKVRFNKLYNNHDGLILYHVKDCNIMGNIIHDNINGLILKVSKNNTLYNNTIYNSQYNFGIETSYPGLDNNNIATNNTINGKPIYFWVGQSNKTIPLDAGYVGLISCNNITVRNLNLNRNYQGIFLESTENSTITNNTISNNLQGIEGYNSSFYLNLNSITNNNIKGIYVYEIFNTKISRNNISNNNLNNLSRCFVFSSCIGIQIEDSHQINISENNFSHDVSNGILSEGIQDYVINHNVINDSNIGIYVYAANGKISDNIIYNNSYGMDLNGGVNSNINIDNNTIFKNKKVGFQFLSFRQSNITQNIIFDNPIGIIASNHGYTHIFNKNMIYNNEIGINLSGSPNVIYDNYFNNTQDNIGSKNNEWYVNKISGRNIVGGPFLGGNYWSKYVGIDLDGDYIGDTQLPFGPGDYLPLLIAPVIIDYTNDLPMTGRNFSFNVSVYIKVGIKNVNVEYWIDGGKQLLMPMTLVSGNNIDGNYSKTIIIPSNVKNLHYFISAFDTHNNRNVTLVKNLTVVDIIPPIIEDPSGIPKTGDNFTFNLTIMDNIGIKNYTLTYWFDDGNRYSFNESDINTVIKIPLSAHILNYTMTVFDRSNNIARREYSKIVLDIIPPQIDIATLKPQTGENFFFKCFVTDNWGVDWVNLTYWYNGYKKTGKMQLTGDIFEYFVSVPVNATLVQFSIVAMDKSGNFQILNNSLAVLDGISPFIIDQSKGNPIAGQRYSIQANISDNIAVKNAYVEYWFSTEKKRLDLEFVNGLYIGNIIIPNGEKRLHYIIYAEDRSGNNASTHENDLSIMPGRTYISPYLMGFFFIILIILIITIAIFYNLSMKDRQKPNKVKKRVKKKRE